MAVSSAARRLRLAAATARGVEGQLRSLAAETNDPHYLECLEQSIEEMGAVARDLEGLSGRCRQDRRRGRRE